MKILLVAIAATLVPAAEHTSRPADAWRAPVKVSPATPHRDRHSIHSYFNTNPESPDGKWLLYFTSDTPEAHTGDIRILERATGKEKVIARNVLTEDAHRAACQQWTSNGRRVVYHDYRKGEWIIAAVDVSTLEERVVTRGRMAGWGQPHSNLVPIYGPHYAPGKHTGLELLDVESGAIRPVVSAEAVRAKYPELVAKVFGERPVSIYFPILSPDTTRVLFKMSTPLGDDFRSKNASFRELLIAYDIERARFLFGHSKWGHPAWHANSRTVINVPTVLIDTNDGSVRPIAGMPRFPGSHPSISPDGRLFATDVIENARESCGIAVGDLTGDAHAVIHRFDGSQGATSWRPSHPHPVFSADGRRVYFNVNAGQWTELYVAERGE
jgi:hypothetical protein